MFIINALLPGTIALTTHLENACRQLYQRFLKAFSPYGEPNIPIDASFLETAAAAALLQRLQAHSERWHRDHWCQCGLWCVIRGLWARVCVLCLPLCVCIHVCLCVPGVKETSFVLWV